MTRNLCPKCGTPMRIVRFRRGATLIACPKCHPEFFIVRKRKRFIHPDWITELRQRKIDDTVKPEE